jgi:hypothetical protein
MAGSSGGSRFCYSGMALAMLLDRLAHDWKAHAMDENVFLEDSLEEALERRGTS